MQQGILIVVEGGVVYVEYLVYFEIIFEMNDIVGCDLMVFVFDDLVIGVDVCLQVDVVVYVCFGEDSMNFVFNEYLFVNEVVKWMLDGCEKWFDLSWLVIIDEIDMVVCLMLCVCDVIEICELIVQVGE